jgi:predicted NUDIX family NTP pyrophosphohydrolase
VYRRRGAELEVLLVHPGGPFWAKRDEGAWSLPKGEIDDPADEPLAVARREFEEELGVAPPDTGGAIALGEVRQAGGKRVTAWAVEGDLDVSATASSTFEMEWPPRSGRTETFPEVDRAGWFGVAEARDKLLQGQRPFLDRLADAVATA